MREIAAIDGDESGFDLVESPRIERDKIFDGAGHQPIAGAIGFLRETVEGLQR